MRIYLNKKFFFGSFCYLFFMRQSPVELSIFLSVQQKCAPCGFINKTQKIIYCFFFLNTFQVRLKLFKTNKNQICAPKHADILACLWYLSSMIPQHGSLWLCIDGQFLEVCSMHDDLSSNLCMCLIKTKKGERLTKIYKFFLYALKSKSNTSSKMVLHLCYYKITGLK